MRRGARTFENLISLSSVIFVAILAISSCHKDDNTPITIQVAGIEFAPNCFLKDGVMVGIDTDIATTAMQNAGVNLEKGLATSWDEAYNATLTGKNRALLTAGYSLERKNLFK